MTSTSSIREILFYSLLSCTLLGTHVRPAGDHTTQEAHFSGIKLNHAVLKGSLSGNVILQNPKSNKFTLS